ncbi:MAG: hypothetical protein AABX83_00580 [Nanoarchaeota archaeon]
MSLFRKRTETVVDLTVLQKSGTLQRARAIAKRDNAQTVASNEFIDLTNSSQSNSSASPISSASPNLDFLSSIAGASTIEPIRESENSENSNDNVHHLKNKIEDLEYKLERLIERLGKVEDKLLKED